APRARMPDAPALKPDALRPPLPPVPTRRSSDLPPPQRGEQPKPAALAPVVAAVAGNRKVEGMLLEVVSEKTGYPAEMLEMGMALDADLGSDSIKRVAILSALLERQPEAPAVKPA